MVRPNQVNINKYKIDGITNVKKIRTRKYLRIKSAMGRKWIL